MKRVLLGFSGGVDSFFSAYLLKEKGFKVDLVFFRLLDQVDLEKPKKVAELLNLPLTVIDLRKEFKELVIDYFISYYKRGLTPNPCTVCNREVKLKFLHFLKEELSYDFIATGHYARALYDERLKRVVVKRGKDPKKEQSYFLSLVEAKVIQSLILPLGDFTKEEVIKRAEELGYPFKGESQDICFIPQGDYSEFLKEFITVKPGNFKLKDGTILGKHKGIIYYTVGQRRGLGIPYEYPLYVVELRPKENEVILGSKEEVKRDSFCLWRVNWQVLPQELEKGEIEAQVRYRASPVKVKKLRYFNSGIYCVKLAAKVEAPTPGQVCAFYSGDLLLGGGEIIRKEPTDDREHSINRLDPCSSSG